MTKTYSELIQCESFASRYQYLRLGGTVGIATFGFDRHLNQTFYHSYEWRNIRDEVITRDLGCDLGVQGFDIHGQLLVHHMNPIDAQDILDREDHILDPEFLITTTTTTHNAIHFGDSKLLRQPVKARTPGDTTLW